MQRFLVVFQIIAALVIGVGLLAFARQIAVLNKTVASTAAAVAATHGSLFTGPGSITQKELAQIHATQQRLDVLAFNLEHARTIGFKRRRAEQPSAQGNYILDMTEGGLESTGSNLDVAIVGDGFFHILVAPDEGDGTAYTRVGIFRINKAGDLVINAGGDHELIPRIKLLPNASNISITGDGLVYYTRPDDGATCLAGPIQLGRFINPSGLVPHDSYYLESDESGAPEITNADQGVAGSLMQGYLEQSNVSSVSEWAAMVDAQQQLQLDRKATELLERTRQTVASLEKN